MNETLLSSLFSLALTIMFGVLGTKDLGSTQSFIAFGGSLIMICIFAYNFFHYINNDSIQENEE